MPLRRLITKMVCVTHVNVQRALIYMYMYMYFTFASTHVLFASLHYCLHLCVFVSVHVHLSASVHEHPYSFRHIHIVKRPGAGRSLESATSGCVLGSRTFKMYYMYIVHTCTCTCIPQFVFIVQAYQHYQEVKYVNAMVDDFGVDDELRSNEELYSGTFSQLMNIACTVTADEEQSQSASLFEAACAEKIQQFDDSESDEEVYVYMYMYMYMYIHNMYMYTCMCTVKV